MTTWVRSETIRRGLTPLFLQGRRFSEKLADVQRHPVADDVGDVIVKHAGGQLVQRKLAVLVDDGVPRRCFRPESG